VTEPVLLDAQSNPRLPVFQFARLPVVFVLRNPPLGSLQAAFRRRRVDRAATRAG
jgi:hypothetical protein